MEELTKFVTGQFQKNINERSFKDILKSEEGKFYMNWSNSLCDINYVK